MKVQGHGQAKVLSSEEINRLFAALKGDSDQTLFAVCFFTGCRINEACTMLTGDVFDASGVRDEITIRRANTKGKQETR